MDTKELTKLLWIKDHEKIGIKYKLIETCLVSDVSVHDPKALGSLISEEENKPLYADSAYTRPNQDQVISEFKMINQIGGKGHRKPPLTDQQQVSNKVKSKIRARVEHVFGFMGQSIKGLFIRSFGLAGATAIIGLINLAYNIFRYEQLMSGSC